MIQQRRSNLRRRSQRGRGRLALRVALLGSLLLAVLVPLASQSATSFEFRLPSGKPFPVYRASSVTVPNDLVPNAIDEGEASLRPAIEDAIRNADGIRSLRYLRYSLPVPTITVSGQQTTVIAQVSGVESLDLSVRFRPDNGFARFLCGSNVRVDVSMTDVALEVSYDFFTGEPIDVAILYRTLHVNEDCNIPILGDIAELLNDIFNFVDVVEEVVSAINDGETFAENLLNGRFANRFALEDALQGIRENGPREIRDASEDALRLLGGLRSAVAAYITNHVTEDLVDRLNLVTQAQIDALHDRLEGLEEFIAEGLPGLSLMDLPDLAHPSFDLSDYLDDRLPDVRAFLLARLNGVYGNAVTAVAGLEVRAIDALEAFVSADFGRLLGGVNARLRVYRSTKLVVVDAFHDAPASFIGRAEAIAPCFQDYTVAFTENVTRFKVYAPSGALYAQGPSRTYMSHGFLGSVIAENYFGLHSYPTQGQVRLINWGDYPGGRANFRWPRCPVAGAPPPTPPAPPPPPPPPPAPPTPPGGGLPPWEQCGGNTGIICR